MKNVVDFSKLKHGHYTEIEGAKYEALVSKGRKMLVNLSNYTDAGEANVRRSELKGKLRRSEWDAILLTDYGATINTRRVIQAGHEWYIAPDGTTCNRWHLYEHYKQTTL